MREMKDSGIEWIGAIPSYWETQRIKLVLQERNETNNPIKSDDILSLTNDRGVIPYEEKGDVGNKSKEDLTGYKLAYPDDVVLNSMNVIIGSVGLSKYYGCVSPVYYVLFARNKEHSIQFYNYVFQSKQFQENLKGYGNGIMEIRMRIQMSKLNTVQIPVPPASEQNRIAFFLNNQCKKIDQIIEQQQEVIEKLKEYKKTIITEAVAFGLRDSECIESPYWGISKIPANWKAGQLKYFATLRSGITLGKSYPEGTKLVEYPYLRVANVQGDYVDLSDVATIFVTEDEAKKYKLSDGEVLMTEGGDRDKLGRGCVWNNEIPHCLHQNHIFAVRTDTTKLLSQYFDYVTSSSIARNYFDYTAKKTTNLASTNSTIILDFRFPIPPIEEQQEIIEYLKSKCSTIDNAVVKKQTIIDQLKEFKKSLIYEAVTGKLEV